MIERYFILPKDFGFTKFLKTFESKAPKNYIYTSEINYIIDYLYNWIYDVHFKGIWIAGGTGTGKTTLMKIFFEVIKELNIEFCFGEDNNEVHYKLYPKMTSEKEINNYFAKCGEIPQRRSLFIDDVGNDCKKVNYFGNDSLVISDIIYNRYDKLETKQYLFITSNYPLNHPIIKEMYGERTQSRLLAMCEYLELKKTNFRNM